LLGELGHHRAPCAAHAAFLPLHLFAGQPQLLRSRTFCRLRSARSSSLLREHRVEHPQVPGGRALSTRPCGSSSSERASRERTPFNPSPLGVGHASEITVLRELKAARRFDYVVVSAGFVIGSGELFKTSFCDQAKQSRLRVIGPGTNYWSCVQVDESFAERRRPERDRDADYSGSARDGSPQRMRVACRAPGRGGRRPSDRSPRARGPQG
jgi:hypothetical protein